jgi:uncharacterized integral membrane protein (TIGR00698 family)
MSLTPHASDGAASTLQGHWFLSQYTLIPGILLAAAVAVISYVISPLLKPLLPAPTMVVALVIGMLAYPIAAKPVFQPGLIFCVRHLLRWAVALLGLRIALGDIVALGFGSAVVVVLGMAVTVVVGLAAARMLRLSDSFGALAGAATAVCGASAALATASVLPDYRQKSLDVAFVVIGVNLLSTVAMILYPLIASPLGLGDTATGVMLGGTIHDVAQVVGAGYAVSTPVGNAAVIVKLFRVFLLLPVTLAIGWYFSARETPAGRAPFPVPVFAVVFLLLCFFNTAEPYFDLGPAYDRTKAVLGEFSNWGLLIAISALGLGTTFASLSTLGWRHLATLTGTTLVILFVVTLGLLAIQ